MDGFNEWFNKFHHTKPAEPSAPHAASFTEKVAFEHRLKQYDQELERWQRGLLAQTEVGTKCSGSGVLQTVISLRTWQYKLVYHIWAVVICSLMPYTVNYLYYVSTLFRDPAVLYQIARI